MTGQPYLSAKHRGSHRDPIGTTLTALWMGGHVAVAVLLGFTIHSQQEFRDQAAPAPHNLPDCDPPLA